ncbi:hypothetical protein TNCV_841021 [Trichonephila clavipes]|nr:hypothetical protein TNCV_841021 [Trichonephila clavipes]
MASPNLSKDDRARHCGNPTRITSVVSAAAPGLETIMVSRARLPLSDSKSTPAAAPPRLLHQRAPSRIRIHPTIRLLFPVFSFGLQLSCMGLVHMHKHMHIRKKNDKKKVDQRYNVIHNKGWKCYSL